jgi:hypothetical protein
MKNSLNYQAVEQILKATKGKSSLSKKNKNLSIGDNVISKVFGQAQLAHWQILGFAEAEVWWMAYGDSRDAQADWFPGNTGEAAVVMKLRNQERYAIGRESDIISLIKSAREFKSIETGCYGI